MRFEVLQIPEELEPMLDLYRERKPKRVLEIGCWDGGTLKHWLTEHTPELVVAVDLEHRNREHYDEWRSPKTDLWVYTGQSQDAPQVEAMRSHAPYDWVFIDGDHGDWGVSVDVETCLPLVREGGLMLLHDIEAGTDFGGDMYAPRKELLKLAEDRETWEYVVPERQPWAHGIGVVQL